MTAGPLIITNHNLMKKRRPKILTRIYILITQLSLKGFLANGQGTKRFWDYDYCAINLPLPRSSRFSPRKSYMYKPGASPWRLKTKLFDLL